MLNMPMRSFALVLLLPAAATCLHDINNGFRSVSFRGGASSNIDRSNKPDWLDMDRDTLQGYMTLAKERHADAVRKAEQSYWSASSSKEQTDHPSPTLPEVDAYGIATPPTWSLPDFAKDFDISRMIFVTQKDTPLFSQEECRKVIQMAEAHFEGGPWSTLPSGQFDVAGFWIKSVPAVHEWFNHVVRTKLVPLLQKQFPDFVVSPSDLVVDNAYLFKYNPETGRRTDVHTDSGCLSFTIALNGPEDYTGGGTWFQGLCASDGTPVPLVEMTTGHVTVRPGGVRHCGHAVAQGTRYIIGGFCLHRHKVEYVRMLIGLGAERAGQQDWKGAQEALEAALMLNPNFDGAYANLANVLEQQGNAKKAQQVLEHCHCHVNRLSGEVAYSLGVLYLNQQEYDKCKACLEACLEVDDCDADAMMGMAQACSGQGDRDGEERWYRRLVKTPGVPHEAAASAYCNLGVLHEGNDQEILLYRQGLELAPNHFQLRFSLASAQAARKDWSGAAESFRLALGVANTAQAQSQTLNALYRVAVNMVQVEFQANPPSREALIEKLQAIMGKDNYAQLAASSAR